MSRNRTIGLDTGNSRASEWQLDAILYIAHYAYRPIDRTDLPTKTMPAKRNDLLQGALVLVVLQALSSRSKMHGYAITTHIQQTSSDLLRVKEGSLYPALRRMEEAGWVTAQWGLTDKNREARFYSLTAKGRAQLEDERESWSRVSRGISKVLRYA